MLNEKENSESKILPGSILRVSFASDQSQNLSNALFFFLPYLGVHDFKGGQQVQKQFTVKSSDDRLVTVVLTENAADHETRHITFHTDDCLRDYHYYLGQGIEFLSRPEYDKRGLIAHFLDPQDNIYTLLEERNYTDF